MGRGVETTEITSFVEGCDTEETVSNLTGDPIEGENHTNKNKVRVRSLRRTCVCVCMGVVYAQHNSPIGDDDVRDE